MKTFAILYYAIIVISFSRAQTDDPASGTVDVLLAEEAPTMDPSTETDETVVVDIPVNPSTDSLPATSICFDQAHCPSGQLCCGNPIPCPPGAFCPAFRLFGDCKDVCAPDEISLTGPAGPALPTSSS